MPETGDFLGQLTDELPPADHIVEFVSTGPKQYAYRTLKNLEVCKLRGFSLNYHNSKIVNFDVLKDFVYEIQPYRNTTLQNPNNIVRNKKDIEIVTRPMPKIYQPVYTKRQIQPDNCVFTLPYGF